MAENEKKQATCKNCGELHNVEPTEDFGDACSLHCAIELAWERKGTDPRMPDIHTGGF